MKKREGKKYVLVARVSSREHSEEGYSLEAQVRAMRDWCAKHGHEVARVFELAAIGNRKHNRRLLAEVLDFVRANRRSNGGEVDGIVFHTTERVGDTLTDIMLINDQGVDVQFVQETCADDAAGRMTWAMIVFVARFYAEQLGEQVKKEMVERVGA